MAKTVHRVLLIEDDRFLAGMYEKKLRLEKFDVRVAHDGEEGLRLCEVYKPDIILLDILLPKLSGFEVLKAARASDACRTTPVLVLSNLSQQRDIARCMELGATDYLIKSHFMPSEVIQRIRAILQ